MTQAWQADWYRLTTVDAIAGGQGAAVSVAGVSIVARRHGGAILAHREECTGCGASLLNASLQASSASITCSACGTVHTLEGADAEDGPLHLPVMVVDEIAYVFLPPAPEPGADGA